MRVSTGLILIAIAAVPLASAISGERTDTVTGYFCDSRQEQVAFLGLKAAGENEIMAADAVNKSVRRMSCAPYLPATAVHTGEQTVTADGLVYKLQSYLFLPEKVERWSGTVFGPVQSTAGEQDV